MLLAVGELLLEDLDLGGTLCDVVVCIFVVHLECAKLLHTLVVAFGHLLLEGLDLVGPSSDSGLYFGLLFFTLSQVLVELLALLTDLTDFCTMLILEFRVLLVQLAYL